MRCPEPLYWSPLPLGWRKTVVLFCGGGGGGVGGAALALAIAVDSGGVPSSAAAAAARPLLLSLRTSPACRARCQSLGILARAEEGGREGQRPCLISDGGSGAALAIVL